MIQFSGIWYNLKLKKICFILQNAACFWLLSSSCSSPCILSSNQYDTVSDTATCWIVSFHFSAQREKWTMQLTLAWLLCANSEQCSGEKSIGWWEWSGSSSEHFGVVWSNSQINETKLTELPWV